MANVTKSQLLDLVAQLERQVEDDRRRIGIMMYEANQLQHKVNELQDTVDDLTSQLQESPTCDELDDANDIIKTQAARIKLLSQKVAAQPKTAPPASPKKPAPKPQPVSAEIESQPTVEINDFDRAMYHKFQALDRATRLAIIEFARPLVGHVGIHNIVTVRAAWHEFQASVEDAIDEQYQAAEDVADMQVS